MHPKQKTRPVKPSARAAPRSKASTAGELPEQEQELDDLDIDEALLAFVMTPALGADHLLVLALSPGGDSTIQDRQAAEAKRIPEKLAIAISAACERYAETERRAVRFRAAWQRGDKTLATYTWEMGSGKAERELDGSVQSFLIDQQSNARELHKLQLESFEMVQEGWRSLHTLQNKRIESLERENHELRDRLRKMDDVQTEIAIEQMRVEQEQRGRTVDLIEKRVLPLAQAFAVRQLEQQSAATATANSKPEQREQEKPTA